MLIGECWEPKYEIYKISKNLQISPLILEFFLYVPNSNLDDQEI